MTDTKQFLADTDTVANWDAVQRDSMMWLYRDGEPMFDEPVRITFASKEKLEYGDRNELDAGRAKPVPIFADGSKPTDGWQIRRLR